MIVLLSLLAAVPILAVGSVITALLLFWPVMLLLGAVHAQPGLEWVPALGWWPTLLVIALLRLLLPLGASSGSDS